MNDARGSNYAVCIGSKGDLDSVRYVGPAVDHLPPPNAVVFCEGEDARRPIG